MSPRVPLVHRPGLSRRAGLPAVAVSALLLLSGCGSGQFAQTYQEKAVADATNDAIGAIAVRNLLVVPPTSGTVHPAGSSAPVAVRLVNQGSQPDVLLSASTPAAASVVVTGPTPQLRVPELGTADPAYGLLLQNLTRPLPTGTWINLTLTFQVNGTKEMLVPVKVSPEQVAREEHEYEVAETDSEGNPIVKGDNVPEEGSDPKGDNSQDPPVSE